MTRCNFEKIYLYDAKLVTLINIRYLYYALIIVIIIPSYTLSDWTTKINGGDRKY